VGHFLSADTPPKSESLLDTLSPLSVPLIHPTAQHNNMPYILCTPGLLVARHVESNEVEVAYLPLEERATAKGCPYERLS
jgi:hypothetical protein